MKTVFSRWLLMIGLFVLFLGTEGFAADQAPVDAPEKQVTWTISINGAPNAVRAFGFDILFPQNLLTYQKIEKGALLKGGFAYFGANEIAPGKLRIGGMEPGKSSVPKGTSGVLATVTFSQKAGEKAAAPTFKIVDIKDDMHGWPVSGDNKKQKEALSIVPAGN